MALLASIKILLSLFSTCLSLMPKPMPHILSFHYGSILLPGTKIYSDYLVLQNKLFQNLMAYDNKHLFCSQIENVGRACHGQLVSAECGTS